MKKLIALLALCAFLAAGLAACDKKPASPTSKPAGAGGGGGGEEKK